MTTNFYSQKSNSINHSAIKLAAISALYDQTFRCKTMLKEYLLGTVLDTHIKPMIDPQYFDAVKGLIDLVLIDLVALIHQKVGVINAPIYCSTYLLSVFYKDSIQRDRMLSKIHRPMHPDKRVSNTNLVLNEVARDLCSRAIVRRFRPIYDEGNLLTRHEEGFDSIVEIFACHKPYTASLNTIVRLLVYGKPYVPTLYDSIFYPVFSISPAHHQDYTLLGRVDDPDVDPDITRQPPLDADATNPHVVATLERICLNEVSKCVDTYLYNDALKNPSLIIAAKALSEFLCIAYPVTLLFVKKAQRAGVFDKSNRDGLLSMLTVEFSHLVEDDDDMNYLLILLMGLTNGDGYDSDYSVTPII